MSSFGIGRYESGLSPPTSSVRMMIGRSGPTASDDRPVVLELLVFRRRVAAFHEEELGAQQADAFAAELGDLAGVVDAADVREDVDPRAVERDGRLVRVREVLLAPPLGAFLCARGCASLPPATRAARSVPLLPSRMTSRPVGQLERRRLDAGQRRNAQRAGEDRHVRRGPAARRAEAHDARAVQRRRVRRREVFGDEDGVGRVLRRADVDARSAATARAGRRRAGRWRAARAAGCAARPAGRRAS